MPIPQHIKFIVRWAEKPAQSNRQDACSTTYQFIVGWAEKPAQSNRQDACSTTY
ncbi:MULTISPECIES: hypothetical protein [unclassified Microcoleus]